MSKEIIISIITFLSGLIGGSGLVGGFLFYKLKQREIAYQARFEKLSERKVEIYLKCATFLRRVKSYKMVEAFEIWNKLADELLLWASGDVYTRASNFLIKLAKDPSGQGLDWQEEIAPVIEAMVEDVNPGTTIQSSDILPYAQFVPMNPEIQEIEQLSFTDPLKFRKVAENLKENVKLREEIIKYKMGDLAMVTKILRAEIKDH